MSTFALPLFLIACVPEGTFNFNLWRPSAAWGHGHSFSIDWPFMDAGSAGWPTFLAAKDSVHKATNAITPPSERATKIR